jgi:Icc-related predicted phosphoesterase
MSAKTKRLRLAAVGDLHYRASSRGTLAALFDQMRESADVVVLCGDLTDRGLLPEARALAEDIAARLKPPIVAVLGNHDVEGGEESAISEVLSAAGVAVLDGDALEIAGVGFAGTKGFCGGFGRSMLEPWGERIIKQFVEEAVSEAHKLESALAKLHTDRRIAVLHYAPIHDTVQGELPEIIPYLGSTRLVEPIDAFGARLALHGHAHYGRLEGRTRSGVPVYNCALPLRRRLEPSRPFLVVDL